MCASKPRNVALRQIRRINDAIVYFRKWPSLRSQKEAIRGLEDLSNTAAKECIDEFNRLLRTVGPAVQFQVQHRNTAMLLLFGLGSISFFFCSKKICLIKHGDRRALGYLEMTYGF